MRGAQGRDGLGPLCVVVGDPGRGTATALQVRRRASGGTVPSTAVSTFRSMPELSARSYADVSRQSAIAGRSP